MALSLTAEKKASRQARLDRMAPAAREALKAKRQTRLQKLRDARRGQTEAVKKIAAEVVKGVSPKKAPAKKPTGKKK